MNRKLSTIAIIVLAALTMVSVDAMAAKKAKKNKKGKKEEKVAGFEGTWTMEGTFGDPMRSWVMFYPDPSKKLDIKGMSVWPCHCNAKDLKKAVKTRAAKDPDFPQTIEKLFGKRVRVTVKTAMAVKDGNSCRFKKKGNQEWVSIELLPEDKTQ